MNIFFLLICSWLGTASAAATPVRIAYPAAGTIVSAQIGLIFEKTDILKKHGLEARISSLGTGRELKTALVSGQVDIILTSQANFVVLLGEGFPAKAINSLGSAGRLALVVAKASAVQNLSDLKGRKIATIFGTSLHKPAMQWAVEAGGAEVVNISQVGALHAALESGAVAAALTYDPFLTELKDKVRILKEDRFDLITVAADKSVSAETIAAVNRAFHDAVLYLRENRDQVDGWFSAQARISPNAVRESSRQNRNYKADLGAPVELAISAELKRSLRAEGEFLFERKIIKKAPDIETHVLKF